MELIWRALLSPGEALRSLAQGFAPWRGLSLVIAGTTGSTLASWLASPPGRGRLAAAAITLAGRAAFDLALWLFSAALLAQAASWLAPGGTGHERGGFLGAVAVASAFRAWLIPVGAVARLTGVVGILAAGRAAAWIAVLALLWTGVREAGRMGGGRAALCLILGLILPAALAALGAVLAGLGWLLNPLFPPGISPFPPL